MTSIDNANVMTNSAGVKTAQVSYHFKLTDVAPWAQSQEMQTAFPKLNGVQAGSHPARATLVMNGDQWQVSQQQQQ
ncbi:MAG: hypothetical protein M3Y72_03435 [Acidobacteriota bacterium]|nr:hypothetical protein [Acidobacteriota bacterium]